jgi:hypothetical protein
MKNSMKSLSVAALLLAGLWIAPFRAESADASTASQMSAVEGGRALHVIVSQSEIDSAIIPHTYGAMTGGGLIPGIIDASISASRAKRAEKLITPVREAIVDIDADALALSSAQTAFAETPWFKANPTAYFSKDSSVVAMNAVLDGASTDQIAFVQYTYDLTPNFDSVRVVADIIVADKAIPVSAKGKGEKRLNWKNLKYTAKVTSIIKLPLADDDRAINAALWSADGGALTRKALAAAFAQLAALTQRTLALTADDMATLNDKSNKPVDIGGYVGRIQTPPTGSTLLWNNGYIQITRLN